MPRRTAFCAPSRTPLRRPTSSTCWPSLASRLGDEEQAVTYFLRSVELRESLKFRGNLDPEISRLIRKYGLFREDFE